MIVVNSLSAVRVRVLALRFQILLNKFHVLFQLMNIKNIYTYIKEIAQDHSTNVIAPDGRLNILSDFSPNLLYES